MKRNLLIFALCASVTLPIALLLASRSSGEPPAEQVKVTSSGSVVVRSDPNWSCTFVYTDTKPFITVTKDVSTNQPSLTPGKTDRH
jgi:hypothetical protein